MKFLMFADLHYAPGVFYGSDLETPRMFIQKAQETGCDFILHAGDLCHGPSRVPELMEVFDNSPIPVYHCLGNHDTDGTPYEETLRMYHMPDGHYYFDTCGYRFLVLDPNYCKLEDQYVHYDMGNYFQWPGNRDHTPPEQLDWIEKTIDESPYPCLLVSHDSYERDANGARDYLAVQEIIRKANQKSPHKVLMVMNGHYHRDFIRILDNVIHWDINSVTYDWVGEPEHKGMYPQELYDQFSCMKYIVPYTDPLYAIVTVEGTTVTIEGTESTMLNGINREHLGAKICDLAGRPVTPKIQSAKITLG